MRVLGEGVPLCSLLSHLALPGHSCDWADTPPEASLKTKFFAGKWKEFPHSLTRLWLVLKARDHRPGWAGTQGNPSQKKGPGALSPYYRPEWRKGKSHYYIHAACQCRPGLSPTKNKQTNKPRETILKPALGRQVLSRSWPDTPVTHFHFSFLKNNLGEGLG